MVVFKRDAFVYPPIVLSPKGGTGAICRWGNGGEERKRGELTRGEHDKKRGVRAESGLVAVSLRGQAKVVYWLRN